MPTNRRRKTRTSNRIPLVFTDEFKAHLECSDFLGELTEQEIPIAKQLGLYCWDATVKGWKNAK